MEKITLKPVTKELLFKTEDLNAHVDVLTYGGTTTQEKALGSLFLIGHIKFEEEDLGYVISLISSLAKREYYSEASLKTQDPKKAFEGTLRKLNEVLEDFFKNKTFALNVGLGSIAGDQLLLSKLGKFKVALARNNEYIDVFNDVVLFQKSPEHEEQFSNVISGKLQPGDKLFAYYPSRPITSRERSLQGVLIKEDQEQFTAKITQLSNTTDAFACCGVHIMMEQIKEIPLESPISMTSPSAILAEAPRSPKPELEARQAPIVAELSLNKRSGVFSSIASTALKMRGISRLPLHTRFRTFVIVAALILVPFTGIALWRSSGESSELKNAYREATQNLKLAQSHIAQNNPSEARTLLTNTLALIGAFEQEKFVLVRKEADIALDLVDNVRPETPEFISTLTETPQGKVLAFEDQTPSVIYDGEALLQVKSKLFTLADPVISVDATIYEGNLYILAEAGNVYKYSDALSGTTKRADWGTLKGDVFSIAVDGNLFALQADGTVATYFRGEQKSAFTLNLPIDTSSRLITAPDLPIIYMANPITKRLYAIDKTSGVLQGTYKLDSMGDLKDIALSAEGNVLMTSSDLKLWKLTVVQP